MSNTTTSVFIAAAILCLPVTSAMSSDCVPGVEEANNLPKGLLGAICTVESANNPSAIHHNDGKGDSLGLCQIKLATARLVGFRGTRKQLMHPKTNALYAAKYLKHQISRYHGNYAKAVTAYNQGTTYNHGGSEYLAKVFTAWATAQ